MQPYDRGNLNWSGQFKGPGSPLLNKWILQGFSKKNSFIGLG